LREKLYDTTNADDKASIQGEIDAAQFEADLLQADFDAADAKEEEYKRVKKAEADAAADVVYKEKAEKRQKQKDAMELKRIDFD